MTRPPFTIIDDGRLLEVEEPEGTALAEQAATAGRPVALDPAERVACLGVAARDRARVLTTLAAPDFALPDLAGRHHALSAHRGRKVLLVAYASW